jgi:hypothetical protein
MATFVATFSVYRENSMKKLYKSLNNRLLKTFTIGQGDSSTRRIG